MYHERLTEAAACQERVVACSAGRANAHGAQRGSELGRSIAPAGRRPGARGAPTAGSCWHRPGGPGARRASTNRGGSPIAAAATSTSSPTCARSWRSTRGARAGRRPGACARSWRSTAALVLDVAQELGGLGGLAVGESPHRSTPRDSPSWSRWRWRWSPSNSRGVTSSAGALAVFAELLAAVTIRIAVALVRRPGGDHAARPRRALGGGGGGAGVPSSPRWSPSARRWRRWRWRGRGARGCRARGPGARPRRWPPPRCSAVSSLASMATLPRAGRWSGLRSTAGPWPDRVPGYSSSSSSIRRNARRRALGSAPERRSASAASSSAATGSATTCSGSAAFRCTPLHSTALDAPSTNLSARDSVTGASSSASALEVGAWERARGGHPRRPHPRGDGVRGDAGRATRGLGVGGQDAQGVGAPERPFFSSPFPRLASTAAKCSESPPDPAAIGCSADELRPPRVMRSFKTSAHVRSQCSPRL